MSTNLSQYTSGGIAVGVPSSGGGGSSSSSATVALIFHGRQKGLLTQGLAVGMTARTDTQSGLAADGNSFTVGADGDYLVDIQLTNDYHNQYSRNPKFKFKVSGVEVIVQMEKKNSGYFELSTVKRSIALETGDLITFETSGNIGVPCELAVTIYKIG